MLPMKQTRILAIDGGGIKGLVSAMVLVELEKLLCFYSGDRTARVGEYFDVIGGTSTGSILAALYLCPGENGKPKYSAKEVLQFYLDWGDYVFKKRYLYPVNTLFGLSGPKFQNKQLKEKLNDYFGDITLRELTKHCVITSYETENRKAVFFSSISEKEEECSVLVRDAILASTAAPTYFPPVQIEGKHSYIDGGVYAGNPALCTLIESLKLCDCNSFEDTFVLSVGNVYNEEEYRYKKIKHWGKICWAIPIFDILMDSSNQVIDYQMRKIYQTLGLSDHYYRMSLKANCKIPSMDDTSKESMDKFMNFGEELLHLRFDELVKIAKLLLK